MDGAWVDRLEKRFGFLAVPGLPGFLAGMTALGTELKNQTDWKTTRSRITGYIQGGQLTLTVSSGSTTTTTPVTVPAGSGGSLGAYGGSLTGWTNVVWLLNQNYSLPASVAYTR